MLLLLTKGCEVHANSMVNLRRVLRAAPERVCRAFLDADAMATWLPPNGFTGKVHNIDPKVGGGYRMSFTKLMTGTSRSFGGVFLELALLAKLVEAESPDRGDL